jgi:IS605 OrfB family transposase
MQHGCCAPPAKLRGCCNGARAPGYVNDPANTVSVTRTLRLKVKPAASAWLNAAAMEVDAVWNWANETSAKAARLAQAQRRGHRRRVKRLHRRAANRRKDALHKFSRRIVDRYQNIVVGDASSTQLAQTRVAKAVLDSGWGMLRQMLQYTGEHAARSVSVVCESCTSRACSCGGSLSGPRGVNGLRVRRWTCVDCGESHDRDVNAARNILGRAEASASLSGNESSPSKLRQAEPHALARQGRD